MKVTAVIAEFNPFTNGHKYCLDAARKQTGADYIICIMSGSFVQRGGPAVTDKWTRAKAALLCGADLVIELPTLFATSTAQIFAEGGVRTALATGVCDTLFFGAKADTDFISEIGKCCADENEEYKSILKDYLNEGLSFARARQSALGEYLNLTENERNMLAEPNTILACEYASACEKFSSGSLKIGSVKRLGQDYNDDTPSSSLNSSASAIRRAYIEGNTEFIKSGIPYEVYDIFASHPFVSSESLLPFIKFKAIEGGENGLSQITDVTEGLQNRILPAILSKATIDEITAEASSKRYPQARIRRILFSYLLGITKDIIDEARTNPIPYLRILGMKRDASPLLKEMKKRASAAIITNLPDFKDILKDCIMLNTDIAATDIYNICAQYGTGISGMDYIRKPEII
ncbi:MAG: nucleotidyltransferase family protein [Clostridiales bacterium]|nr:nucleotidyltransferase family protein [Clostridiales bacterium]